jgi:CheY-like chemotaxis protein
VNAIVAKGFCEKLGHTVEIAENGLIATKKAQQNHYDLILMDNHMPEMNGVEATRFIRKNLGLGTLLFAYTADVFREAHDNFIEAGADHVLTKPLQRESFTDALKQFSSRLPVQVIGEAEQSENVVQLHREPIEKLRLTEEELTHSETIEILKEEPQALVDLLQSIVCDFESAVDELIELFMVEDLDSLHSTLHTTKGMALNLGLDTLANQALEIETQVKNRQTPEIEQLQKLINRLQVNVHQGQRLIEKARSQMNDSNQVT